MQKQDIDKLESLILLRLYFYYGGGTTTTSTNSTFKLDGTTVKTGAYTYSPGYTLLGTKLITVKHNADGTFPDRKISIYGTSYHITATTKEYILKSPTIPNIDVLNSFSIKIDESLEDGKIPTKITINIDKGNESFNSNIKYKWNTDIITLANDISDTSYEWEIPYEELLNTSLNDLKKLLNIYVETLNNSKVSLGTKNAAISYDFNIQPVFTYTYSNDYLNTRDLTGNETSIIANYTDVAFTIKPDKLYGSAVISYDYLVNNIINNASATSLFALSNTKIGLNEDIRQLRITTSRGLSHTVDLDMVVINYFKPWFKKIEFSRPELHIVRFNVEGNSWKGNFGTLENQIVNLKYKYKKSIDEDDNGYTDWVDFPKDIILGPDDNGYFVIEDYDDEIHFEQDQYDIIILLEDLTGNYVQLENTATSSIPFFSAFDETMLFNARFIINTLYTKWRGLNLPFASINSNLIDGVPVEGYTITGKNENPSNIIGGEWELAYKKCRDKSFSSTDNDLFNINTTNVTSHSTLIQITDNIMTIRASIVNKIALADTTIELGNFNFKNIGIDKLVMNEYTIGQADGGNGLVMNRLTNDTGILYSDDVVTKVSGGTIAAANTIMIMLTIPIKWDSINDDICDEFHWRRIA